jgi:hypothetical protein
MSLSTRHQTSPLVSVGGIKLVLFRVAAPTVLSDCIEIMHGPVNMLRARPLDDSAVCGAHRSFQRV